MMMVKNKYFIILFLLVFLLTGCNLPTKSTPTPLPTLAFATDIATFPTATLIPSSSPTSSLYGTVSGTVCYPGEAIPPMVVFLENINTHVVYEVEIAQNQTSYSSTLPPGGYMGFAWLPDFSLGGSYSAAVTCGLGASCTDHTVHTFFITAGAETSDINICDWYGGANAVPTPSNKG